jgi:hypothetical protein
MSVWHKSDMMKRARKPSRLGYLANCAFFEIQDRFTGLRIDFLCPALDRKAACFLRRNNDWSEFFCDR